MSVTHAIYAKKIVEHIKLMYNVNLKKYNIIYGSIKPDISVLFSKHPHYINKSLNEMCKNVNLLIKLTDGRYGIESRSFARELGTVLHYTADFFCKAHNDINGQPHLTNYYHILYEQRFQNQLRAYELDVVRENVINFIDYNLEKIKDTSLKNYIKTSHNKYMKLAGKQYLCNRFEKERMIDLNYSFGMSIIIASYIVESILSKNNL